MTDWKAVVLPPLRIGASGWFRVLWRGAILGLMVYGGLVLLLLVRLVERPIFGLVRPWTPYITQGVCRAAFFILGIKTEMSGKPLATPGAMVANHSSWMDIFALNAAARIYFVAKSEVEGWAGIGWLARATGTIFIARKGVEAKRQQEVFETRLRIGHKLLFFPEGTSTDSLRVLPFKSTLFAAFFSVDTPTPLHIQPVTVMYHVPKGKDPRHYAWWGDMTFAPHLLKVLADGDPGRIEVIFHPAVAVRDFADRKALAAYCEGVIRAGHALID